MDVRRETLPTEPYISEERSSLKEAFSLVQ